MSFIPLVQSDVIPTEEVIMAVPVTPQPEPAITPAPTEIDYSLDYNLVPIKVKVSHYNPKLGGPNCYNFVNGVCLSRLANGQNWAKFLGQYNTIACPSEWAFGTQILLDGNVFTCRDRGGAIVKTYDGKYWIDILAATVPYTFGQTRKAFLMVPKN